MSFHPATFNLTVYDPSLYAGHPQPLSFFQQQPPAPAPPTGRSVSSFPGNVPSQYLDRGHDDPKFPFMPSLPSELQGPLAFRNGTQASRTVVPRLSLPGVSNSTFVQLPVLWTALSLALGVEVQGEIIRGLPCIQRHNQLFCRTAGTSYPTEKIERFIDDNKALMRRMYGEFLDNFDTIQQSQSGRTFRTGRSVESFADQIPELMTEYHADDRRGESFFNLIRTKRQSLPGSINTNPDRVDSCESKTEIVTPYWANNSAGKVRAIVNTNEFSQAIHQEVCVKQSTKRCGGECACEQKYKWHRLLAYDPDNDCRGIFMDWFLFPSCCSCRCTPL
ncbi:protein spaetzle 3-like isoform X3 [Penaeus japonicus]|uniref:protein spaetzle 3-like isoform X3 n=1 Tax=Penaeus japonicus TaxID=27405 RepID=UPI001C7136DC|nr:protein spaetzle 3-like isoform X3 [Penaeus japonicus]